MDPSIQIYTSYRKGLKTIQGSFPIFNNAGLFGCNVSSVVPIKKDEFLNLDEFVDSFYLITDDSDQYNEVKIIMYVENIPFNLIF
jgi:hypothetical protein